jgi:hypothetical protein
MSVITASKSYDELHGAISKRGDLQVVVLGCGQCEFGEAGCKMLRIAEEQARRLSRGQPAR